MEPRSNFERAYAECVLAGYIFVKGFKFIDVYSQDRTYVGFVDLFSPQCRFYGDDLEGDLLWKACEWLKKRQI